MGRGMKGPRNEAHRKQTRRTHVGIRDNQGIRKPNTAGKHPSFQEMIFPALISGYIEVPLIQMGKLGSVTEMKT